MWRVPYHTDGGLIFRPMSVQGDELEEKLYANMSMCHLKLENWARAIETADKVGVPQYPEIARLTSACLVLQALKKNPENYKAMFRKGKALGSQGYYEKAAVVLEELRRKNPAGRS